MPWDCLISAKDRGQAMTPSTKSNELYEAAGRNVQIDDGSRLAEREKPLGVEAESGPNRRACTRAKWRVCEGPASSLGHVQFQRGNLNRRVGVQSAHEGIADRLEEAHKGGEPTRVDRRQIARRKHVCTMRALLGSGGHSSHWPWKSFGGSSVRAKQLTAMPGCAPASVRPCYFSNPKSLRSNYLTW